MQLQRADHTSTPAPGRIRLLFRGGTTLEWDASPSQENWEEFRAWRLHTDDQPAWLVFTHDCIAEKLPVQLTADARGFIPGDRHWANTAAPCHSMRATVHGLSRLFGAQWIPSRDDQDHARRHRMVCDGWVITLDERTDHDDVMRQAKRERHPASTHALEVHRHDNQPFTAKAADDLLAGLMFGLSFAMDRWTPPLFAKGYDTTGKAVWAEWAPLHIDPVNRGSQRWWNDHRLEDLTSFMELWVAMWNSHHERATRRFLITSVLAAGERVFVEQRLSTRIAALELFGAFAQEGHTPRLDNPITEVPRPCVGDGPASRRLRGLLTAAHIDTDIPPQCNRLHQFGVWATERAGAQTPPDGPAIVTLIRNRLAHPQDTEPLYRDEGMVAQAADLAGRYLELMLLWDLGYQGHARDRTIRRGWAGESDPVPWAQQSST